MVSCLILTAMLFAQESSEPIRPRADDKKDRLICKREVPIGSLIASRKICRTHAEWEKVAMDGQCEARRLYQLGVGQARLEC